MKILLEKGKKYFIQEERCIPIIEEYDVIVAGGGAAGFAAAYGSAKAGANTLLIERNSFLGGTATAGLMANMIINKDGLVGVARDIIDRLSKIEGGAWLGRVVAFSPELMKQVALEMLVEERVHLLFYTTASELIMDDNVVKGVVLENKSGRQAVLARVVIDCTGDADPAYRAGAPTNMGREDDHKMRPLSLLFRLGNINLQTIEKYYFDNPTQFMLDPHCNVLEENVLRLEGFYYIMESARERGEVDKDIHYLRFEAADRKNGTVIINTVRVYGYDGSNANDLTCGEIEARKQMMQLIEVIKKYVPGCERAFLIDAAVNIGVRETRRIIGEYVYTDVDAWEQRKYNDTVVELWARGLLNSELHSPDAGEGLRDDNHYEMAKSFDPRIIPPAPQRNFFFPYRGLIPQNIEGLLVAGRCMSVSHFGDTWTRGIMTCMACGHVTGVAAALVSKLNVGIRNLDLNILRCELKKQKVATGY
jgi:hypothetical protein